MPNTVTTYEIENSNGLTGGAWSRSYETLAVAATEIANTLGWPEGAFIGPKMVDLIDGTDTEQTAWCVYPTAEERDADPDGGHAPRVVRVEAPAPLTADTISDSEIRALRRESAAAGDLEQVEICDIALSAAPIRMLSVIGADGVAIEVYEDYRELCADAINAGQD